ncbi:hypothetical protein BC827DRAFT_1272694 [Russula dissimulans]|nr:hypothetical protein BC827DRAFT_1272694 [Russula dissimulans]
MRMNVLSDEDRIKFYRRVCRRAAQHFDIDIDDDATQEPSSLRNLRGEMPVERELTPAVLRRRSHHEVIDVDELDDEPDRRRSRRSAPQDNYSRASIPSDIIVLDSDDDSEPGPSTRQRQSDARLRPPPPPVQIIQTPPPVPPLPPRPRPQHLPPDVIRPNAEPFAFEGTMAARVARPTSYPPPGNAPPSRHRPVINLGGGFISSSNLEAEFLRRQQRDRARQRYFEHLRIARGIYHRHGFLSQTIGRIFPSWLFGDPTEEEMLDALAFSELAAGEASPYGFGDDETPIRRTTNEYRVAYTHPYPPAPGFTHDFESPSPSVSVIDVDEEPGPSAKPSGSSSLKKNESPITLVCARCLDPLVLGWSNMSEDERTRCRLWGLRCGHMLDGKCIGELMKPHPTLELELASTEPAAVEPHDNKSQGLSNQSHDRTQNLILGDTNLPGPKSPTGPTRARGKARAIEQPSQSSQPVDGASERTTFTEDSSIRSRLRPRNDPRHVIHISSSSPSSSHVSTQPSSQRHSAANISHQSKNRPKGKGKQKATKPVILERHEWRCPVALCERVHLSLHIESQGWVMDETQGAIPIFA